MTEIQPEANLNGDYENNYFQDVNFSITPDQIAERIKNRDIPKINTPEITERLARTWGCSALQAKNGLEITLNSIIDLTIASKHLTLHNFGRWELKQQTINRVPTLNAVKNPIHFNKISFHPSKNFSDYVNTHYMRKSESSSFGLDRVHSTGSQHLFSYTSSIQVSDSNLLKKVILSSKASMEELSEMMVCKGMPTNTIAKNFFWSLAQIIGDRVSIGQSVYLVGLGKFEPRLAAERTIINPWTGNKAESPAHLKIHYHASKNFKARADTAYPPQIQ